MAPCTFVRPCPDAPVTADPGRYLLWENTQAEGAPARSLADLCDDWLARRLDLPGQPLVLPRLGFDAATATQRAVLTAALGTGPIAAVKLDHGGNAAKALPRDAEIALLRQLRALGWRLLIDRGFGAGRRVRRQQDVVTGALVLGSALATELVTRRRARA